MLSKWKYKNKIVDTVDKMPENVYGFVYEVTIEIEGKKYFYVGRKNVFSVRNIKLSKKQLDARTDKRASKKKQVVKESDWRTYCGSNKRIKEAIAKYGVDTLNISRKIIDFAYSEVQLKFMEMKEIICNDLLLRDEYLNDNISIKHIGKPNFLS